jgi:hypothetical protein
MLNTLGDETDGNPDGEMPKSGRRHAERII